MPRVRFLGPLAAGVLALAGCNASGGQTTTLVGIPIPTPSGSSATADALVQITVPAAPAPSALRRVKYVSPATQSLAVAPAGGTPVVVTLTAGTPGCVTSAAGLVCAASVALPVGANQSFFVTTYASTNGTGTALTANTITASIVAGQANPIPLSLGGVPSSIALTGPAAAIPTVAATSVPVTVAVKDASGNTIIGSEPIVNAQGQPVTVALADGDTSGATSISPATLSAPGTAAVAYDNYFQPTSATVTASGTGLTPATATLTFARKTIAFYFTGTATPQLVANSGIEARGRHAHASAARRAQSLAPSNFFGALIPTGSASAPYALGGNFPASSTTVLDAIDLWPTGMATYSDGSMYFTDKIAGGSYGLFNAGKTPGWPSAGAVIAPASPQALGPLAMGPGGKMYATVRGGFAQINPATGAIIGNAVTASAAQYQQLLPNAIAVGADGTVYIELYAAPAGGDEVVAFAPSAGGFVLSHAFWTANSNETSDAIFGLAVDATNHVYISEDALGTIDVVPAASNGLTLPSMVYSDDIQIQDGTQVLVDRDGNIIWATTQTVSVYAPNSGTVPPPGTNPALIFGPPVTPALQTVIAPGPYTSYGLAFGPGS